MFSINEFKAIAELDLDPIKAKLMHKESGEGWTREYADQMELEYRRFLHLMKLYPNEAIAPLFDVDTFWHYHILDTMKYAADCESLFGYFLHHYPYVGLGGEEKDEIEHQRVGDRMKELYLLAFGESEAPGNDVVVAGKDDIKTAWCFTPERTVAWCFAEGRNAAMAGARSAWCFAESPTPAMEKRVTAWCFAEGRASVMAARTTAWCFADGRHIASAANKTAWCAASSDKTAWCFADRRQVTAPADHIAWCFADGRHAINRADSRFFDRSAGSQAAPESTALV